MAQRICPLRAGSKNALALDPDISYQQFDQWTSCATAKLAQKAPFCLAVEASPSWQTICLLFAAWRLSQPVFLFPPKTPKALLQKTFLQIPSLLLIDPSSAFFSGSSTEEAYLNLSSLALLLLTSGSSGTPKLAAFTLTQLFASAEQVLQVLQAKPQDRWLLSLPLYHVGGLGVLLRALCSEGTLIFANRTLSHSERLLSSRARFASYVPTQLYRLLQEEFSHTPSTHLLIGGAPLSQTLYQKALEHKLFLSLTYGLTEMSSTVLLTSQPVWGQDLLPYLGFPLPKCELVLSDANELLVRGKPLFEGYGYPPLKRFDWFPSGDLAEIHPSYGFKIRGRKDLQFFCGGENILPEEIELALLSLPEMEQAIVVPLYDEEFGAKPVAFVQTTLTETKLFTLLSDLLPRPKIPVLFLPLKSSKSLKQNRKKLTEIINNQKHKNKHVQKKTPNL